MGAGYIQEIPETLRHEVGHLKQEQEGKDLKKWDYVESELDVEGRTKLPDYREEAKAEGEKPEALQDLPEPSTSEPSEEEHYTSEDIKD
jgi:hypothetical protein